MSDFHTLLPISSYLKQQSNNITSQSLTKNAIYDYIMFCLCPCVKQGEITTKVHREQALPQLKDNLGLQLGTEGCKTCVLTGILNSCGGPCSIPLGKFCSSSVGV